MRSLRSTFRIRIFPFVISVPSVVKTILLSDGRAPLAPTPDLGFYSDSPEIFPLLRKCQPLVNLPHRFYVAFAVFDDLGKFTGSVVGVDFGAVEVFFG